MILVVVDKDLNEFERRFTEIGIANTVIDTEFGKTEEYYWMTLECKD
jgi:hypothetical protein